MHSNSSNSSADMMIPWLHFTGGDNLYFKSWRPTSPGAIVGACIGLVFLALFERWLAATRGILEAHWRRRALAMASRHMSNHYETISRPPSSEETREKPPEAEPDTRAVSEPTIQQSPSTSLARPKQKFRLIAPFIPTQDLPRGAIHAAQVLLGYLLMLAVMTFQAAYIISIIVGLGVGEVVFGRIGSSESPTTH